jgi:hypothetical protein
MSSENEELQFDRVDIAGASPDTAATGPAVTCTVCQKPVGAEYYHANDKPVCENCRHVLIAAAATPRSMGPLVRAGLCGLAGAIAGAAINYAVIAITKFEIGLVAILIGYMVGYMVRKGAGGRGGRRFQVVALLLTYWAVGLAYAPLAFKEFRSSDTASSEAADAAKAATPAAVPDTSIATTLGDDEPFTWSSFLFALGVTFVFVFALPVMYVIGSFPGGILSALIIGFGMLQAWSMTRAHKIEISGPYKVGGGPAPAAG